MSYDLEFFSTPEDFLAAAAPVLRAEPVLCTVIASVTARLQRSAAVRPDDAPAPWWVVVRDGPEAVGLAMRTAPLSPYPPYLGPMPGDAARVLADALAERGEAVQVVNGFFPGIEVFAGDRATRETERTTLFELGDLVEPREVPGRLRIARAEELDLVYGWFEAFGTDASEQAGRSEPHPRIETRESTAARIEAGDVWLWEVEGVATQVTAFNPASFGVARVGPVYTPKEHRGHGYAAAAVAEISGRLQREGARVCLFADQQNTTSTNVYVRLGYRPLAETGGLLLS